MNGSTHACEPGRPEWAWPGADAVGDTQVTTLMRLLEEIDYGMLLVDAGGALRYANQLGLRELRGGGPLHLLQGSLRAGAPAEHDALLRALAEAQRGRRRLFTAGHNGAAVSIAVVPMPSGDDAGAETLVLLVFGKRHASDTLTIDFYARTHGLTGAEMTVLKAICGGLQPKDVAREQGVAISTVRSHICSIRTKTQTGSIRELVNRVAVLPPITPVVKPAAGEVVQQGAAATTH